MNEPYVRPVLTEAEVTAIRGLAGLLEWEDGLTSLRGPMPTETKQELKRNIISAKPDSNTQQISKIIMSAVDRDHRFLRITQALETYEPIICRMSESSWYRTHHDSWSNGQFSTTVFLSSPDEYEGGELNLRVGSLDYDFKLPIGQAITYSTGMPHQVKEVTKGERLAAVFWTHSMIKDPSIRSILCTLEEARAHLPHLKAYESIDKAYESPEFLIEKAVNDLRREFATSS